VPVESENPSFRDVRSETPYNNDKVTSPEVLERLRKEHPAFRGDWSQLERLMRNLDADKNSPALKPEERLKEWNEWVESALERREFVHLEGANLAQRHLERVGMPCAHLEQANFCKAHCKHARLIQTHLEGANLLRARFDRAIFFQAHMGKASLWEGHFEGAYLVEAHLEGASLREARFDDANLAGAHLGGTRLVEAVFDRADLRGATGLRFDENSVLRTRIRGNAPDPWSVLRRKYTGPWFFCHLLLLVLFFAPYAGRVLALSAVAHGQMWIQEKSHRVAEILDEHSPGTSVPARAMLEQADAEFHARFRQVSALWVLIGGTTGRWAVSFGIVVAAYNALRFVLTLRVGMLRDAEERSSVTPRLIEYWGMMRPPRQKQPQRPSSPTGFLASIRRAPAAIGRPVLACAVAVFCVWDDTRWERFWPGWSRAVVARRWQRWLYAWMRRMPARLQEHWDDYQTRGVGVAARLGLWRLHCIARVLKWVVIASVVINTLVWGWTTTVPVPR